MELKDLKPVHKLKRKKRVGRGGKRGTYSGKGMEGQKARSGRRLKPSIRVFIKKYPKLRGYKFKSQGLESVIVNIGDLEKKFKDGQTVNPETLIEKKIIRKIKGKTPQVKILGKGELTKKLIIEKCELSEGAREKIKKSSGKIK